MAWHIERAIMKVYAAWALVDAGGDGKQGIYFTWPYAIIHL